MASDALIAHLKEHSVREGDFTLKSGRKSRWFIDSKQTVCRPDGIIAVTDAALEVIPAATTAIGGLTMGADPVAYGIAAVAATRGSQSSILRDPQRVERTRRHGPTRRRTAARRQGCDHRGHRYSWVIAPRGGGRGERDRSRGDPGSSRRRSRRDMRGDGRGRGNPVHRARDRDGPRVRLRRLNFGEPRSHR